MDPSDPSKDRSEEEKEATSENERKTRGERGAERSRKRSLRILIRCLVSFSFSVVGSFVVSVLVGIVAFSIGNLSASTSVSVPSTCKILSSSVDIRSSKICELGFLNYKAKHVFYPSEKRRFRCHDDYYWASIFQYDYNVPIGVLMNMTMVMESGGNILGDIDDTVVPLPTSSAVFHITQLVPGALIKPTNNGQTFQTVAEAPKEALPRYCRPDFSTAWLAQSKFKVNETYNCRYTLGNWKADIYSDNNFFNCQAEEPSLIELVKRLSILFIRFFLNYNVDRRQMLSYAFLGVVAGISSGLLATFFGVVFHKGIQRIFLCISSKHSTGRALATRLKSICLLVTYLSALGWLTLQYGQFIGLKQLVLDSRFKDWLVY